MSKQKITRRDFMRRTAGVAGATLAARSILLEPLSLAAAARAVPPSDRVRFGIIGIGMQGSRLKKPGEVKYYLDKWISKNPRMAKAKQLDMVAGGVSVCQPLDCVTADGIMLVGDAARQIDPMTGGGIANSCVAAQIAGKVAGQALEENDFSKAFLQRYEKGWRAELEEHLFRNWMAKEKAMNISDDVFDKLISLLAEVGMENINVFNILKAIQTKYPEIVKDFEDLL